MNQSCQDPTLVCVCLCENVNWTSVCELHYSNNWRCCGLDYLNYIVPVTLWSIFLCMSLLFGWHTGILRELKRNVDDLHEITTQALGVVVARQKKSILGKEISDPRRILMLLAMVTELFGFSYLPVQLLLYEFTDGSFTAQSSPSFQWTKYIIFTTLLLIITLPRFLTKFMDNFITKVLAPLLYDTCCIIYVYTIIDIGACTNGMENVAFSDGSTCASPERYWIFATIGIVTFVMFYSNTLLYKKRLSNQVFAVRFRFQSSFVSLMSYTRTACCLGFFTIQKLLIYYDKVNVFLVSALVNLVIFVILLGYNYFNQPCLGVGLFPNNLRSLSFASSCYSSFALLVISCMLKLRGNETMDHIERHVFYLFITGYIAFAPTIWYINHRRAINYHVPNLSLKQSLSHSNPRVRAIAAVSVALEDQELWTQRDVFDLFELLNINLNIPSSIEHGLITVYTCQALWNLWFRHYRLDMTVDEPCTTDFAPTDIWVTSSQVNLNTPKLVLSPTLAHESDLLQLVERSTAVGKHTRRRSLRIDSTTQVNKAISNCVNCLVALSRASHPPTRLIACQVLQEMYANGVLVVSSNTLIFMCCTLCGSPTMSVATSAATTLYRLFTSRYLMSDVINTSFTEYWNLLHISKYISNAGTAEIACAEKLAAVLLRITESIEMSSRRLNPANYLSDGFVSNLVHAQDIAISYTLYSLIDDICLRIYWACDLYMVQLHSVMAIKINPFSLKNRLFSLRKATSVVPLSITRRKTSKSIRRKGVSLQKITSFLIRTEFSNLVTRDHLNAIKARKADEATLIIQMYLVLQEGLYNFLKPSELSAGSQMMLRVLSRSFNENRMLYKYALEILTPSEVQYLNYLHTAASAKRAPILREAFTSLSAKRAMKVVQILKPRRWESADVSNSPSSQFQALSVAAPTAILARKSIGNNNPAPIVAATAIKKSIKEEKKRNRPPPKKPSSGPVNLLDFASKKSIAQPKKPTSVGNSGMRVSAAPFVPGNDVKNTIELRGDQSNAAKQPNNHQKPVEKKKKKKSTLKKKILKDRAEKWAAYHADKAKQTNVESGVNPDKIQAIYVYNMIDPEEVEDDDEYADTLDDISQQFNRHGAISSIDIDRDTGRIEAIYESSTSADSALAAFHNSTFGGQKVICIYATPSHIDAACWVTISNYIVPADVEDDDEYEEIVSEVQGLFSKKHQIRHLEINRESGICRAQYKTPNEARDIAQTYNQKSFGGKPIDVQWAGGIVESTIPTNIEPLPPVRKLCNANQIREYVD
ncbi:hypothetical protein THRCLA_05418, partial [Thraustotheca clavata]